MEWEDIYGSPWFNCSGTPPVLIDNWLLSEYEDTLGVVDNAGNVCEVGFPDGSTTMPWMMAQTK